MGQREKLNQRQLKKAVGSLLKYVGQSKDEKVQLLDDDDIFYLNFSLKKAIVEQRNDKPIRIDIPHPLYTFEGAEVCLFVKDHKGEGHKDAKKQLDKYQKRAGVSKVVGLSKLRTKYESFEAKRQLCNMFDLFLADDRILPSLPKLIGKSFFKKKKQPIPVNLRGTDWPTQVKKACDATYLFRPNGTTVSIKIAHSSLTPEDIVENINTAVEGIVKHIPKGWDNVQAVFLKTAESVALPLLQCLPDQTAAQTQETTA